MNTNRLQLVAGLLLIVLGIAFLLVQYFEFGPVLFLTILGVLFILAYAFTRVYGFLIPGCILIGIGIGLAFERINPAISVSLGLGLGFIAIFVAHRLVAGASHWWPLIPGGALVLVGIAEAIPQGQMLIEKGWPLILIAIGLAILGGQFMMRLPENK